MPLTYKQFAREADFSGLFYACRQALLIGMLPVEVERYKRQYEQQGRSFIGLSK